MRRAEYTPLWEVNVNDLMGAESVYVYGKAYDTARDQAWAAVFVGDLTALVQRKGAHNHLLRIGAGGSTTDIYEVADFRPSIGFSQNFALSRSGELFLHDPKQNVVRRYSPSGDLMGETLIDANVLYVTPHGEGILTYSYDAYNICHYTLSGEILWNYHLPLPPSQIFLRSDGEDAWAYVTTSELAAIHLHADHKVVGLEHLFPCRTKYRFYRDPDLDKGELVFDINLHDVTPGPLPASSLLHFYPETSKGSRNSDGLFLLHEWGKGVRSLPWPPQLGGLVGAAESDILLAGRGQFDGSVKQSTVVAVTAPDWRKARRYP